ncbi:hypothetical protein FGG08_003715 [Glutinoglossum americanum]|uniref:MARVEL domain-containing protein n=1 Tax=Glutinoglossum americanum TaxID=1670608 RepID=A0A9P8I918_9PEZI|nr:hypothetical protein FGG08_003715 [Glutinoglossum americanum]
MEVEGQGPAAHARAEVDGSGSEHVVQLPGFVLFIRIAQAIVALLIMALAAASINALYSWTSIVGSFSFMIFIVWSLGFILFVSVSTVIAAVYLIVIPLVLPALYNCWAALALEILGVIAWLIVFAIMTAWAAANTAAKLVNNSSGAGSVLYTGPGAKAYYSMAPDTLFFPSSSPQHMGIQSPSQKFE